jgi:hypothetical protein
LSITVPPRFGESCDAAEPCGDVVESSTAAVGGRRAQLRLA